MAILKPLVIFMGILIAVLFGVVVWRMATIVGGGDPVAALEPVSLGLPEGCHIVAATLADDRLVVVVRAEDPSGAGTCDGVHIMDMASGAVIGNIRP